MIKQILVWVDDREATRAQVKWAIELARVLTAQLYAVYILPLEPETHRKRKPIPREEKAWEVLYEVEDEAFEQQVRISLLIETGDPIEKLCELLRSYKIDLLVVSASCSIPAIELIRHSPQPVVFIKQNNNKEV
ncbi:MAG: universal stress protein [candidate division WOR-3 bacterium]